jgi:Neocarzinostatin family
MDLRGRRKGVLGALVVALALAIAPSAASALPSVTVAPSAGLSSPATVQVSGSGWTASSPIALRECTVDNIDCTAVLATAKTDGTGNFGPVAATVTQTFVGNSTGGTIDCSATLCVVWGRNSLCACFETAQTPIAFAPPGTTPAPTENADKRAAAVQKCKRRAKKRGWSKKKLRKCKRRAVSALG